MHVFPENDRMRLTYRHCSGFWQMRYLYAPTYWTPGIFPLLFDLLGNSPAPWSLHHQSRQLATLRRSIGNTFSQVIVISYNCTVTDLITFFCLFKNAISASISAGSPFHAATFFVRILAAPVAGNRCHPYAYIRLHMRCYWIRGTPRHSAKYSRRFRFRSSASQPPYFLPPLLLCTQQVPHNSHHFPLHMEFRIVLLPSFWMPFRYNSGSAVPNSKISPFSMSTIPAVNTPASAFF